MYVSTEVEERLDDLRNGPAAVEPRPFGDVEGRFLPRPGRAGPADDAHPLSL